LPDKKSKLVLWLDDISSRDSAIVGSKAANLGELRRIGIPVPNGFCLTCRAYDLFKRYERAVLSTHVQRRLGSLREKPGVSNCALDRVCFPKQLASSLSSAYDNLTRRIVSKVRLVVVRSSATIEDLSTASFAGIYETVVGVRGFTELVRSVKRCYASLDSPKAILYRRRVGVDRERGAMGVIVQALVDARSSGVMLTADPMSHDNSRIVIEGSWGLGQSVVSGEVTPDQFVLAKPDLEILETKNPRKDSETVFSSGSRRVVRRRVPASRQVACSISKKEATSLARFGLKIEEHFRVPQDIEWAISRDRRIFVMQTRPETTWA
jgi:pyruvate,water dikinase